MRRPGRKPFDPDKAVDPGMARISAVGLLARRDHSVAELRHKLQERGFTPVAIEPVLVDLEAGRLVDDARYGDNVVASRARRGQGPHRIRQELRRSGLARDTIDTAMDKNKDDAPDFVKSAREARVRKFGPEIPVDRKERARQTRFLQYRGFSTDHIRAALEGVEDDVEPDSEPDQS